MSHFDSGKWRLPLLLLLGFSLTASAQMTLLGQLRTRSELRDGVGTLNPIGAKSAGFTSQRTSLIFGYKWDRLTFGANLRDVRVWGQDASTISNADGTGYFCTKPGVRLPWPTVPILPSNLRQSITSPLK